MIFMGFCSHCGAEQAEESVFCSKCGAARTPAETSVATPVVAAKPSTDLIGKIKKLPKLVLVGVPVALVAAIVGGVVLTKALNAPTKANAASFIVTADSVKFDAARDTDITNYTKDQIFGDDCVAGQELTSLLSKGTQWVAGGVQRSGESQNYYHLDQQIISMPTEQDAIDAVKAAVDVAGDTTCDTSSYGTSIAFKFDYENARDIKSVFGVDAQGTVIDSSSWIYMKLSTLVAATESNSTGYYTFVRRGNLLMVIYLNSTDGDGGESDIISKADLKEAVSPLIAKFAG